MDKEGISSLTNICMTWICQNVEVLCVSQKDGSLQIRHCPLFPQELADQLLHKLADEGLLDDKTVGIFQNLEALRLRQAFIRSSRVSAEAFRLSLCPHKLQELNASHIHSDITISDILHNLSSNKHCRQGLHSLLMNGLNLYRETGEIGQARFSALRGLKNLSVAWTDLDDTGLEDICSLPMLECLDVSGANITDLTPLLNCQSRLRSLTVHGLQKLEMSTASLLSVLDKLRVLRHLDISNDRLVTDVDNLVQQLLERPGILPHLVSLDVSGWRGVGDAAVQAFVEARPGMTFIGLLATGAGGSELMSTGGNLKVAGEANLTQVCEALRRYSEQESLLREVLVHLYKYTSEIERSQPDILKLVSDGMQHHTDSLHVQLVATACVFNLTTLELVQGMPLHLLETVVQQLLTAVKNFPNYEQLQKNCLLTLCSDHILQVVPFDRYEATKLMMMLLENHEDQTLQRMAVAVVSILVAKLSTEEISELGAEAFIMKLQQLLSIVQQKATLGVVDSTLKFALSALWNLTDETPTACRHFIQCKGVELYMELLESYFSESSIQQKLLGLLNNVAEVKELRVELQDEDLVEHLLTLLINPAVDVEHSSILTWSYPQREMVSYRTLQPFYQLLQVSEYSGVQLWALWAVQLVCSQNAAQYCSILHTEGGTDILKVLSSHLDTHSDIKSLADNILTMLEQHLVGPESKHPANFPGVSKS
ncbi:protein zyg-11 homolog isoform X3 [Triplophysa dalaica]|uniref:protein zyg-11 homolog isoform X3 n=1 Tax=Triplophysa dalaica TaxID=1582913 RepID=UPI0024DF3D45|nr:protein zyg-11 homolog isoform X3 [Triplophysa dalaica]